MDRFIQQTNIFITSLNIHRLLITTVMVAAIFMDDAFFNNAYYARVGGISTRELNKFDGFISHSSTELHNSGETSEQAGW
ncbi:hypothetical protein ACS0TY_018273 [Phlomoides rotata]